MEDSIINIIIADSNKDYCSIFNEYLSLQNDIIVSGIANSGVETLKLIEEKKPQLVIIDISITNSLGLEVLESLNTIKLNKKPSKIALSSYGQNKIVQKSISLGVIYFIEKPFDIEVLLKKIREIKSLIK